MDTKTVYNYDEKGYYVSDIILDATDKSPSGTFNIPANCSEIQPTFKDGYNTKWNGTAWELVTIPYDVFCYFNNGLDYKTVKSDYAVQSGEVIFKTEPTTEELTKAFTGYTQAVSEKIKKELTVFLQSTIDSKAQEKNYDNGISCASYATSTNETFKTEAIKFIAWRDSVWTLGYAILGKALKGEKYVDTWANYIPTTEELTAVLPKLEW